MKLHLDLMTLTQEHFMFLYNSRFHDLGQNYFMYVFLKADL